MESIWKTSALPFPYGQEGYLPEKVEVAVVGGGLVGILTAHALAQAGISVAVLEAFTPGYGSSGNNTGKVTCQRGACFSPLIEAKGEAAAGLWADACQKAIQDYWALCERYGIKCTPEEVPALLYTNGGDEILVREAEAAGRLSIPNTLCHSKELPLPHTLALSYPQQLQLNPLKFLLGVASQVPVWAGMRVVAVGDDFLYTEEGDRLEFEHLVLATHYPIKTLPAMTFARVMQSTSYAIALRDVPVLGGMYYSVDPQGLSLRSFGNTLIAVGASHRTGAPHPAAYPTLLAVLSKYYPEAKITHRWTAQDCMSEDGLPLVGKVGRHNHYIATAFDKWGLTGAMIASELLSSLIRGERHPLAKILSPARFSVRGLSRTVSQTAHALSGLGKSLFAIPAETAEELSPGTGNVVLHRGRKSAATAQEHTHTCLSPYCTHMGCQVAWNPDSDSWECPCHGSRFSREGIPLDAPATFPLRCTNERKNP